MVAVAIGGAVSGLGSIVGGSQAAAGEKQAASTEAAATQAATQAEQQDFQTAYQALDPYSSAGTTAETELSAELGLGNINQGNYYPNYGTPGSLDAEPSLTDMSPLPGYSFTLQQGNNAVMNAASAQGLAMVPGSGNFSGVEGKGLISYGEGLANTYYNNYLSNYWTNQNNRYNMLNNLVSTGATSAQALGQQAVQTGANVANTTMTGAAGVASAQAAAANATAGGTIGAATGINNALLANALLGNPNSTSTISGGNLGTGYYGASNPANPIDAGGPG